MTVDFTQRFARQIDALRDDRLREKLRAVVRGVMAADSMAGIPRLKKLKGHACAYRIRMGDYRIGLFIEEGSALFAAFEHRKDIYNRFP